VVDYLLPWLDCHHRRWNRSIAASHALLGPAPTSSCGHTQACPAWPPFTSSEPAKAGQSWSDPRSIMHVWCITAHDALQPLPLLPRPPSPPCPQAPHGGVHPLPPPCPGLVLHPHLKPHLVCVVCHYSVTHDCHFPLTAPPPPPPRSDSSTSAVAMSLLNFHIFYRLASSFWCSWQSR
jgi:hypothetical protein